jgi:hypothetical protein
MFEKEISSYGFNIAKRYPGERIALRAVLTDSDIPENFKKFAEAGVDEIIDDEELGRSRTGRIEFSLPEIQTLFKEIRHAVKNSFEFTHEDFLELTGKASKFLFNYVIRPRWTLEKFLFKGEREISKLNFFRAERFLCNYPYYPHGVVEFMEFQNRESIDIESWRKLHAKIDEHLLSTLASNAESLTGSLAELFEFAAGYSKIPIDAMILFFRDKSMNEIVDRIEFAKELKGIQSLDSREFQSILQAPSRDMTQTIDLLPPKSDSSKSYEPLEKRADSGWQGEKVETEKLEEKKEIREKKAGTDRQLSIEPLPSIMTGQKFPSVRTLLNSKDEAKIIKRIFHGSRSLYHIAIHKLDESPDWKAASKIVEGIFIDRDVDPFSKYAVAFTDAINKRFDDNDQT